MSRSELEVGATFDIHIITPTGGGHLFTVHQDRKDEGPLQLISVGKLARLEEIEAMMERMMGEHLDVDVFIYLGTFQLTSRAPLAHIKDQADRLVSNEKQGRNNH